MVFRLIISVFMGLNSNQNLIKPADSGLDLSFEHVKIQQISFALLYKLVSLVISFQHDFPAPFL